MPGALTTVTLRILPDPAGPPAREITGIPWYPGMTALNTMLIADGMLEDSFTFRLVYRSFYGAFIDLIDGVDDTDANFWMLYVDGAPSQTGVSETVLRPAAPGWTVLLEWRFEAVSAGHAQAANKLEVLGRAPQARG